MLKTIRKYNKLLLGVGGTLLLIAFLMPQAIQQLGKASQGRSVGTMDGQKITLASFDLATRELAAVEQFYSNLGMGLPIALDQREDVAHWMLLTREADRAGMVGGPDEGAQLLPEFASMVVRNSFEQIYGRQAQLAMMQMADEVQRRQDEALIGLGRIKNEVAGRSRMTETEFDQTLAKLSGVLRLLNAYRFAERLSDSEMTLIAQRLGDSVVVDSATLSARRLMDETLEPTPEQLQAHFEAYRSLKPGEGEYGLGYKLPTRVKLEWIELNPRLMREAITISMIDSTKHYQQNRDRFPGEFEAERENVENELKTAELEKVFGTAESVVRSEILNAVRPLEQVGEYRVLPDDWAAKKPDFVAMAGRVVEAVQDAYGITIPTPTVRVNDAGWVDEQMIAAEPGIGAATVRFGRQGARFPQLVMAVRELAGESVLGLQVGVPPTDLVAEGQDRTKYYFNILDAAPEATPNSIDELLDPERLTTDWRALQRYHELTAQADEFTARITADGLDTFAESFGTYVPTSSIEGLELDPQPNVAVRTDARVTSENTTGFGALDRNETLQSAILKAGAEIDPTLPIDEVPLNQRVLIVPVPEGLSIVAAKINRVEPLTREMLPMAIRFAQQQRIRETFPGGMPMPYQFTILKQRHRFALDDRDDEEETDAGADSSESSEATAAEENAGETENAPSEGN